MLRRRYYPGGETGEVREWLAGLRSDPQRKKAAWRLDQDIQTLEEFWPRPLNVTVRTLRGWEPLRELKRDYDGIAYRVLFFVFKDTLWLLSAFEKQSAETPRRELKKGRDRLIKVLRANQ
jgi:phage-related protein